MLAAYFAVMEGVETDLLGLRKSINYSKKLGLVFTKNFHEPRKINICLSSLITRIIGTFKVTVL
jgi:hypothetical protein